MRSEGAGTEGVDCSEAWGSCISIETDSGGVEIWNLSGDDGS